jgi:hypothetical protein
MKLRFDLVLAAILVATAGSELVAPDAFSADRACRSGDRPEDTTRIEMTERILAHGYTEISLLARDCDNSWHALAFAEGDPVNVVVTPQGAVLTE